MRFIILGIMRTFLLTLVTIWLFAGVVLAQNTAVAPERFGLAHLSEYLGLKPDDISFRTDYTDPDSLRLKVVADLMAAPLGMIDYAGSLKNAHVKGQPEIAAYIMHSDLALSSGGKRNGAYRPTVDELQNQYNLYYTHLTLNRLLSRAASYIDVIFPGSTELSLGRLSAEQRQFLVTQFKEVVTIGEEEEFLSVEAIDALETTEEGYTETMAGLAPLIDKDPIVAAGIDCLRDLVQDISALRMEISSGQVSVGKMLAGTGTLPVGVSIETYLGKQTGWAIGGTGNDYYSGDYRFILDFGGDDVYNLSYDPKNPHGVIIIDLSGDDHYRSKTDFALASGCMSVGLLLDFGGDDRYDAKSFGLGSGYFGFGLLYDAAGDDRYDGDTHVQAAGTFGLGMLIDESGRDIYNAALFSQGFGFVQGGGMIYDMDGADSYYAGGKYKDVLRYDDHYLSLSQGFGYGLRPWLSGGIGSIIDLKGNDSYYGDIFAQASSYWWSLGLIYDSSGNDNYQGFQYGQGAGTHMSLGIMIDDYGDDVYYGRGLMQGCGHDYSCGLILDRHGDDTYNAFDLSQGAGSANGVGLLIDNEGDDRYLVRKAANTHGYGNPRRDFGSIGLFIDLGGADQYQGTGRDNYYWQTNSKWGGGMDIELNPPDTAGAENE